MTRTRRMLPSLLMTLLSTVVVLVLVRALVLTPYRVASSDMGPAIDRGRRVVVNRWSYGLRLPMSSWLGYHRWASRMPRVGDVVVYNHPADLRHPLAGRQTCIGRCAALPGDTVRAGGVEGVSVALVVPGIKQMVAVTADNIRLLQRTLTLHEGRRAEVRADTLWVDGRPQDRVTFTQDYYWITTDGPDSLTQSPSFGFVPHSHLIGRVMGATR